MATARELQDHDPDGSVNWMADNAAAMKAALSASLERALKVLLADVATPFPRVDSRKVAVNGYFPFIKKRVQVVGLALFVDADSIVFLPALPETSTLADVQIMDRAVSIPTGRQSGFTLGPHQFVSK